MATYITAYGSKNYRSLGGEDGVILKELGPIAVIIGQNNGGKTNILRSLALWHSIRRGRIPTLEATEHYDNDPSNTLSFYFEFDEKSLGELAELKPVGPVYVRYDFISGKGLVYAGSFLETVDEEVLRQYCNTHHSISSSQKELNIKRIVSSDAFQQLIDIPEIVYADDSRAKLDPHSVRQKLDPIWNHGAANRLSIPIKKALKDFIEEGMESDIEIQFEPNGRSFTIQTGEKLVLYESLGNGFQQIFNLALTIASTSNSIVLIDEPELNMHPSLLRRILKLIFTNDTNQYILATHSSLLLDTSYEKSVHQILGGAFSKAVPCGSIQDQKVLLDDLGVKASDLLQSNGIIWVEGPSDRTYIKKWLELYGNSNIEEGLHYTFQYYGGALLAHYDLGSDIDNFVDILNINRNAYIVMDSDWKEAEYDWKESDLAARKSKIISKCKELGIDYWVTAGREIENYISDAAWSEYAQKEVKLGKYDSLQKLIPKYKAKATEAHSVAELIDTAKMYDLQRRVREISSNIESWNFEV